MKILNLLTALCALTSIACSGATKTEENNMQNHSIIEKYSDAGLKHDTFTTPAGRNVNIVFIKHGSIILDVDGYEIYIDPVKMFGTDFTVLPKADAIFVTHEHHDHFDTEALKELTSDKTQIFSSTNVAGQYSIAKAVQPGQGVRVPEADIEVMTTPAYNISEGHLQFHPKERKDIGMIFNIDGLRIYVAGDTEDIPEMASFGDIDVAFIPVNQPYTMTPEQAIHAAEMLQPKALYPYHYGDTDLSPVVEKFAGSDIDVRVRDLQ